VNVLVLWGVEIKNIHNFHETWMTVPLWYIKNIKSGRKTANINTKKTLEVLSQYSTVVLTVVRVIAKYRKSGIWGYRSSLTPEPVELK